MIPPDPRLEIHCRRLGHPVTLAYCVRESIDRPCALVCSCWEGRISIRDYLLTQYAASPGEPSAGPASRLASMVQLIRQAQALRP